MTLDADQIAALAAQGYKLAGTAVVVYKKTGRAGAQMTVERNGQKITFFIKKQK